MPTLIQLRASLRYRLGVPTSDAFYTDTICTELINAALHYNETEQAWGWLEKEATVNTVGGTSSYAVPADYRSSIALLDPSGFELEQTDAKTLRLLVAASGAPKMWDVLGTNLRVAPNPSGVQALIHVYIGTETDLAADGDLPKLPAVWHQAIVECAAWFAFRRAHNAPDAGAAKSAYDSWVEQMKVEAPRYSKDSGGGSVPPPMPSRVQAPPPAGQ